MKDPTLDEQIEITSNLREEMISSGSNLGEYIHLDFLLIDLKLKKMFEDFERTKH